MNDASTPVSAPIVIEILDQIRSQRPLIHCMTNIVVAGFTANALLAVGASPAMVENAEESAEFAQIADGLLVNLGTLTPARVEAMRAAVAAANQAQVPWVFDPVAVGALTFRTKLAAELIAQRPAVVRANPSEVLSLAGATGSTSRGVDATAGSGSAVAAAQNLARRAGSVVAVSGAVDYITDGDTIVQVHTGHELMTRVTGVGCALGALVAACCAVTKSSLMAASAGTAILTVAAQVAASHTDGPGSFAVALLDELYALKPSTLEAHLMAGAR